MRVILLFVLAVVVSSCGPSAQQIKDAKSAEYRAPAKTVLDLALQVAQQKYKIGLIEPDALKFVTAQQWYTREGGRISPNNEFSGDFVNAGGGDVMLSLIVAVHLVEDEKVVVSVTPKVFELVAGSPKPRELVPDDLNVPPWVHGRVNTLALEIHRQATRALDKP